MTRPARPEAGMTMVELLIAVAVTAVIMPPLAGALLMGWRTTGATVDHLAQTGNRQRMPAYLVRDVQSAKTVDTTAADATCTSGGDTLVVRMRWSETVSGATVNRVVSYVRTGSAPNIQLLRRACDDSTGGTTMNGGSTLARDLTAAPTVACFDAASTTTSPSCSSVASVRLSLTDTAGAFFETARRRTS